MYAWLQRYLAVKAFIIEPEYFNLRKDEEGWGTRKT